MLYSDSIHEETIRTAPSQTLTHRASQPLCKDGPLITARPRKSKLRLITSFTQIQFMEEKKSNLSALASHFKFSSLQAASHPIKRFVVVVLIANIWGKGGWGLLTARRVRPQHERTGARFPRPSPPSDLPAETNLSALLMHGSREHVGTRQIRDGCEIHTSLGDRVG